MPNPVEKPPMKIDVEEVMRVIRIETKISHANAMAETGTHKPIPPKEPPAPAPVS